jgi:hypothetical protein
MLYPPRPQVYPPGYPRFPGITGGDYDRIPFLGGGSAGMFGLFRGSQRPRQGSQFGAGHMF